MLGGMVGECWVEWWVSVGDERGIEEEKSMM